MKIFQRIFTTMAVAALLPLAACSPAIVGFSSTPLAATPARLARKAKIATAGATAAVPAPCISSTNAGYTARVCLTAPAPGATLSADTPVEATVTTTGQAPKVQHVAFYLDGKHLLEDFSAPYRFTIPMGAWPNGAHTLSVEAYFKDQFTTEQARIPLTFAAGAQAAAPQFKPTSGSYSGSGPFVMAVVGDGAGGEDSETQVVNLIASWNPNLFLYLGDVYESGSAAEFYNWYAPDTLYGKFRAISDPTVGNHEYITGSDAAYRNYWGNVPDYYSYDAHGWHFISLNSNGSKVGGVGTGSPEYTWLQSDLAKDSAKCTAVYYHHPYLSIGNEGSTPALEPIWRLMAQYHVTLVLSGHDHEYQRWQPMNADGQPDANGITQIIDGTGGHSITKFVNSDPRVVSQYSDGSNTFGAMRWVLNDSSADFSYTTIDGTVRDSGTVTCKGG